MASVGENVQEARAVSSSAASGTAVLGHGIILALYRTTARKFSSALKLHIKLSSDVEEIVPPRSR
jgi:hypothetical protein